MRIKIAPEGEGISGTTLESRPGERGGWMISQAKRRLYLSPREAAEVARVLTNFTAGASDD